MEKSAVYGRKLRGVDAWALLRARQASSAPAQRYGMCFMVFSSKGFLNPGWKAVFRAVRTVRPENASRGKTERIFPYTPLSMRCKIMEKFCEYK